MWPVHAVPVWKMLAVMLVGMTLLPVPVSMDVRGWQEMHPLNGPGWSLFYEYCANILYALVVRRFPKWLLGVLVAVSGATLIRFALTSPSGDIIGGWSLTAEQLGVGFTRMMYPFFGGLLLSRLVRPGHVRRAFWWCSLGLVALLAVPRVGGTEHLWQNGLYDALVVVVLFPLIVWTGASGTVTGRSARVCEFLGDISYPIYITHYPLVYTYTAWVRNHGLTLGEAWPAAAGTVVVSVLLAYAALNGTTSRCAAGSGANSCRHWPLFGFLPVAVFADQGDEPVERLLLRDVAFDDGAPLVEGDAPGSGAHVAVVGVGHLAGAVDDAAHDADFEIFQMRRARLDLRQRPLDVVERAAARGAGDVFGMREAYARRLQDHQLHVAQLGLREAVVEDADPVGQPVQKERPQVAAAFTANVVRSVSS